MYKKISRITSVAIVVALFSSCASMSSMQTARVTNQGEVAFGVGGGYVSTDIQLGEAETIEIAAPLMEVTARYGITERLDVGAKLGIIGTAGLDAKYQFLGDRHSTLASSAGLGVYYLSLTSSSGDTESESSIVDLHIPVYLSVHPTDFFAFYAVPKFIVRRNNYSVNATSETASSNWMGVTTGIRLGRKTGFFAEYSYFGTSSYDAPLGQFMLGIGIGIN